MIEIISIEDTQRYAISTRLLMQEALRKGYQLSYFPSSHMAMSGIVRATKKERELYFKSTCTALSPSFSVFAAGDKFLTYSLLSSRGINMPVTNLLSFDEPIDKVTPLLGQYKKLVVKPVNTDHGDGVSIGVDTESKLRKAIKFARDAGQNETDIIVQQQVYGDEYRFLVVDGKVVAVAARRSPFVVGDGVSTIRELVNEKNKDPRRGEGHAAELTLLDHEQISHHRGKKFLDKIPKKNEEITVLDTTNLSKGGESIDFTDIASPALKKLAVDAATFCFLGIAGVDIMTTDITAATADDSYIIEVNLTPGIRMHQFPSVGKKRDVAKVIFRSIEKTARPIDKKVIKIGRAEQVVLKDIVDKSLPARIDTGATLSSLWASDIKVVDGTLQFKVLGKKSPLYTGKTIYVKDFTQRVISSSTGHTETRYVVRLSVKLKGKVILARFTLADRSTQVYPVLIGRNILRNNFLVDVFGGRKDSIGERRKRALLDEQLKERAQKI